MKRIAATIGAGAFVCFMSWLTGFDFDTRGIEAFVTAYLAACAMIFVYIGPAWGAK